MKDTVHFFFFLYESLVRATLVIVAAYLTTRIIKQRESQLTLHRRNSLIAFSIMMIIQFLIVPFSVSFTGFSLISMPFPWSAAPLQIVETGSYFDWHFLKNFGESGVRAAVIIYIVSQIIIFFGVILYGRRWFCGLLCTMNGCHAETFGEALPFISHDKNNPESKTVHPVVVKILRVFKFIFLFLYLGLMFSWGSYMFFDVEIIGIDILIKFDLITYFSFGLFLMMLGWILIGGRAYCYYCHSGAFLGIVARLCGQKIISGLTECESCGKCNDICKMSIDVMTRAIKSKPVKSIDCVGCGLCIDICPKNNLEYTTGFTRKLKRLRN